MLTQESHPSERRKYERVELEQETELCIRDDHRILISRDISEDGIFLNKSDAQLPTIGTIVSVRPKSAPASSSMVGKVIRVEQNGIAIQFLSTS